MPHLLALLLAAVVLPVTAQTAAQTAAPTAARDGQTVYREACMACHASGLNKAPKPGDAKDWAPRIREGQAGLTAVAWTGIRQMPAKGGRDDLSLEEFSRAVAWMARQSGGNWQDPDAALLSRIDAAVKKREARAKKPANS
jgi:cytochrome c5